MRRKSLLVYVDFGVASLAVFVADVHLFWRASEIAKMLLCSKDGGSEDVLVVLAEGLLLEAGLRLIAKTKSKKCECVITAVCT